MHLLVNTQGTRREGCARHVDSTLVGYDEAARPPLLEIGDRSDQVDRESQVGFGIAKLADRWNARQHRQCWDRVENRLQLSDLLERGAIQLGRTIYPDRPAGRLNVLAGHIVAGAGRFDRNIDTAICDDDYAVGFHAGNGRLDTDASSTRHP